jgi:hypothetical protein
MPGLLEKSQLIVQLSFQQALQKAGDLPSKPRAVV